MPRSQPERYSKEVSAPIATTGHASTAPHWRLKRDGARSIRKSQSAVDAKISASAVLAFIVAPENALRDGSKIQIPSRSREVAPVSKLARMGMATTDLGAAA